MRKSCRWIVLAVAAGASALALAGPAQASSIAFVRDGDIWLTTPDGSREHRVTAGETFLDVTQADDGTIYGRQSGLLYKLDQHGRQLQPPVQTLDLFDLDVTPDGSKIAFWYALSGGGYFDVINSDGSDGNWDDDNGWHPNWVTNDLAITSNGAGWIETIVEGNGGSHYWTSKPDETTKYSVGITRQQDRLVAVYREWGDNFEDTGPYRVAHYSNTSAPPRASELFEAPPEDQQPVLRCTEEIGSAEPQNPRFSPDGTQVAWVYPDGVHVLPVADLEACAQPPGGFILLRATSADWGPANVPLVEPPGPDQCVVPNVTGKKLRKAKKKIRKTFCEVGKVKRKRSGKKKGTVIRQRPRAGTVRDAGAEVKLVVAKRR
jgi:PASTA domain